MEVQVMHAAFKPHHFLDFLYEMAENGGVFETANPFGHVMGKYGNLLAAGKIDSVTFTSGADDPCIPCRNLVDGICMDVFSKEEAELYGFARKYDNSMKLDTDIARALPKVFSFETERSIDQVYKILKEMLTPEIILLNWPRPNRVELTYKGLEMAILARNK